MPVQSMGLLEGGPHGREETESYADADEEAREGQEGLLMPLIVRYDVIHKPSGRWNGCSDKRTVDRYLKREKDLFGRDESEFEVTKVKKYKADIFIDMKTMSTFWAKVD